MTAVEAPERPRLRDEEHLCALLDTPFSDDQLAAITGPLEPELIVAGAGSGKTTVMCARVVWLVGRGLVEPDQVLGLTFSRKAAAELAGRVRAALRALRPGLSTARGADVEPCEPTVSTYHAYAGALISEHGLRLGFEPDLRVVSDATRYQLAARVVGASAGLQTSLSGHLPTVVQYLLDLDAQLQDHLVRPDQVRSHGRALRAALADERQLRDVVRAVDTTRSRDDLLGLVAAYREAKAEAGIAEFADQMARGARLAIECPEIGVAERDRFRVVLLDEYQDTSVSQRRMLQGLFSGAAGNRAAGDSPGGRGHPVSAVGDPCQAIYGWRGASVDNIDAFPEHFPRADGRPAVRRHLTVNRRCSSQVLALANTLAGPLYTAHASGEPLVPRPGASPGTVRAALHRTVAHEVEWVADEVLRAHARHVATDAAAGVPETPWSDIAVLVRDRNEVAELARALRRRHVPVEVVGLSGLLSQPEVADVLATLRVVHELTANADLLRLLTGPRWRIGVRDLALLGERAQDLVDADRRRPQGLRDRLDDAVRGSDPTDVVALADALADPGDDKPYSAEARERFATLAAELSRCAATRASRWSTWSVARSTYWGSRSSWRPHPDRTPSRRATTWRCWSTRWPSSPAPTPGASLPGLLAYLDAEATYERGMSVAEPALTNAVTLLTVHSAKGLEWRSVLVPFCAVRAFPSEQGRPRWQWVASEVPWPLRGDAAALPVIRAWTTAGMDAFRQECQQVQAARGAPAGLRRGDPREVRRGAQRALVGTRPGAAAGTIGLPHRDPCPSAGRRRAGRRTMGRRATRRRGGQPDGGRAAARAIPGCARHRPRRSAASGGRCRARGARGQRRSRPGLRRAPARARRPRATGQAGRARRRARGAAGRDQRRPVRRGGGRPARHGLGHGADAGPVRPGRGRPRAGPAAAAPTLRGRALRLALPRLGRGAGQPAGPARPDRDPRAGGVRHR